MPDYYYKQANVRFGPGGISPAVRNLVIANVAVFIFQIVSDYVLPKGAFDQIFGLSPILVFHGYVWQILTYMFLHAEPMHILMNMFFLWMFGVEVERAMGSRSFTWLYFVSGLGGGLITCLFPPFWGNSVVGASGAVFGVMIAFGLLFPDRMILLFFVIPVKALYMAIFMVGIETFYMIFYMRGGNVAHVTHVAGAFCGYLFLKYGKGLPAKFNIKSRAPRKPRPTGLSEAQEQQRIDDILDKINKDGMHKLSKSDRDFLRKRAMKRKDG